jgi:hypothetical protein
MNDTFKFKNLEKKYEELKREFDKDENKARYIGKARKMLDHIPKVEPLEKYETIIAGLKQLEESGLDYLNENLSRKEDIIERAEVLSHSVDWKNAAEKFRQLDEEWKKIGPAPKEKADDLWNRFYNAKQIFFENRKANFEKFNQERKLNLEKKEKLIVQAEELSASTDWKKTAEKYKYLDEEWKKIGPAPKEMSEEIWDRFYNAKQKFFENRKTYFESLDLEKQSNLAKKKNLCVQAESLSYSTDWKETGEILKQLQSEWKKIGPVPKEYTDELWQRFNDTVQQFFDTRGVYFEERDKERSRKQNGWRERVNETVERLEDTIRHDENQIRELEIKLYNVRHGAREEEIKDNIRDKISQLQEKIDSNRGKINDIQSKL